MSAWYPPRFSDMFTDNLSNWLTNEYSEFEFEGTQETNLTKLSRVSNLTKTSFLTTLSSATKRKLDDLESVSSNQSMYSIKSIRILLENNEDSHIPSNVVDPNQNLQDNSPEVTQRLEEINDERQKSETSSVISEIPTQVDYSQESSYMSTLSGTSNNEELEFWFWNLTNNDKKGGKKYTKKYRKYRKYKKNATKKRKQRYSKKRHQFRVKIRKTMKKY